MTITQNLVPASKYPLKCPYAMTPAGICVHNTANDAAAAGEISYMISNTSQTSFHFAVDDIQAVQGLPLDRNGWHAGDGSDGPGNRKHIGIEICYSKSGGPKFDKAEENAAELIAKLLKERGWGIERVKKHQDFSGKYCPHRTLDLGWDRFLNKVKTKMGGTTVPDTTLYTYLGVANDTEAKAKLKEHLGERDNRTEWGNEEGDRGGFLGSARRDVKKLDGEKNTLQGQVNTLQAQVNDFPAQLEQARKESYDKGFADGVASVPSTNPPQPIPGIDMSKYEDNGVSIETTEGNTKTIVNYKKKV